MEETIKINIDTQKQWNKSQREEMIKLLAVNLFWVVPCFTFSTYLVCFLIT